jgi:hypothetical protein
MSLFKKSVPVPPVDGQGVTHADFLHKALVAAGEWARFADPKALAVLVLLGLGAQDLIGQAGRLTDAHTLDGAWGTIATISFWAAAVFAGGSVAVVSTAVFPRLRGSGGKKKGRSLYYFGDVAGSPNAEEYERAVRRLDQRGIESELARQVYELSRVAKAKHDRTKTAYYVALVFLFLWALSRVALSVAA